MLFSLILLSFNSFVQIYSNDLFIFSLLFAVQGISFACLANCSQAFIFSKLKDENKLNEHIFLLSRLRAVGAVSLGLSIWLGGMLQTLSWNYVFYAEVLFMMLSVLVLSLISTPRVFIKKYETTIKDIIRQNILFWYHKDKILFSILILSIAILGAIETPYFIFSQELFKWYNLSVSEIATLFSCIQVSAGIFTMLSGKIAKRYSLKKIILTSTILVLFITLSNYFPIIILAIILFFASNTICEIVKIVFNDFIQREIPDNIRASATAFIFFIESIFLSIGYLYVGYLFDVTSPNKAIASLSIIASISFILAAIYIFIKDKLSKKIFINKLSETR
jgi:MFS family permease